MTVTAVAASATQSISGISSGDAGIPSSGKAAHTYVSLLEDLTEESGYTLYTAAPAEFIPARMVDLGRIEAALLNIRTADLQRRLHRLFAKNAGFIANRLNDVAGAEDTFEWYGIARRAARRAGDVYTEAWIAGHTCHSCSCYGQAVKPGLTAARMAQSANGNHANAPAVIGYLAEAGAQARVGRRRETLEAVHNADRMFSSLPEKETTEDGLHISEYFLRWHQSNALTAVGAKLQADAFRARALELPFSRQDHVGRLLLHLDDAESAIKYGEVEYGCRTITELWDGLPPEFRVGQIPRRISQIIDSANPACTASREIRAVRELINDRR
ncbi:hypothetical protein [Nocardia asiatica]|uniref:hypothetical protein n=1 Tax=Nocardia asiatica TaxID=209252 RepID=UPI003EE25050